jgi:nitric oxide reductase NorD protein
MVQIDQPHASVEDPMGLQRPVDRDDKESAQELGDMLSELTEARLVSTPGRPREVLLSDDPPSGSSRNGLPPMTTADSGIEYPEWDYRIANYRDRGAIVRLRVLPHGPQHWVDAVLHEHRTMLNEIRRRFELLRPERQTLRRRIDGEEIDLDAYLESDADFRAGLPRSEAIYQTLRPARQSLAIMLLIDVSGSTDSWIAAHKRIIDVERETLLIVCTALDALGEPYAIQAYSGEGPAAVHVWDVKQFNEPYSNAVALRIAALEPEHYTRTGAALRFRPETCH